MARGPKPDPDQAAKGFPGRRKAKAIKDAISAKRVAELLAPTANDVADLPVMLRDKKYAAAANVWRRLAPELRRTHRLPIEAEFYFVQVCIYAQEWVASTEDLHSNGFTQSVKTVSGVEMERRRPKTFDRQQAYSNLAELSVKFGLTPNDMYGLFKGQAAVAQTNPGLFGGERQASAGVTPAPAETEKTETPSSLVGGLGAQRSAPPDRVN